VITPERWDRAVIIGDVVGLMRRYGMDVESKRKARAKGTKSEVITGSGDYRTLDVVAWFQSRNHYKRPMAGGKHAVTCPWCSEHSTPDAPDDTGTVVWEADTGWPTFHCSHNHCDDRTLSDVMALWDDADQFCAREFGGAACTS